LYVISVWFELILQAVYEKEPDAVLATAELVGGVCLNVLTRTDEEEHV
jgi:hypothetical protein